MVRCWLRCASCWLLLLGLDGGCCALSVARSLLSFGVVRWLMCGVSCLVFSDGRCCFVSVCCFFLVVGCWVLLDGCMLLVGG